MINSLFSFPVQGIARGAGGTSPLAPAFMGAAAWIDDLYALVACFDY